MKLIFFFLLIGLTATAQKDSAKVDSARLFMKEVGNSLTLQQFQEWIYKQPISAEKYDEFIQYSNAFWQEEYAKWKLKKQK